MVVSPMIADAKRMAQKYGMTGCVILLFDHAGKTVGGMSYGSNRARCQKLGKLLDSAVDTLLVRQERWQA